MSYNGITKLYPPPHPLVINCETVHIDDLATYVRKPGVLIRVIGYSPSPPASPRPAYLPPKVTECIGCGAPKYYGPCAYCRRP